MFKQIVGLEFSVPLEKCSLIYRHHHKGLHILTYNRHSWLLSIEVYLACHTNCCKEHPFIWSSLRNRDIHPCSQAFSKRAVTNCFNDFGL